MEEYCELLAYHYVHSDNMAKAVEYLDLASQKTVMANAVDDAKGYFDKAMEAAGHLTRQRANPGAADLSAGESRHGVLQALQVGRIL